MTALLVAAVAAESFAVWSVAQGAELAAVLAHALCAACAGGAAGLAPRVRGREPRAGAVIAAVTLVAALPVIGLAGHCCALLPAFRRAGSRARDALIELEMPSLADHRFGVHEPLSGAAALEPLPNAAATLESRILAVTSLRRADAHHAVPLLRAALSDAHEEVRLLAYAILDRREKRVRRRIDAALSLLDGGGRPGAEVAEGARVAVLRGLAEEHLELARCISLSGKPVGSTLERAAEYAWTALALRRSVAGHVLLARVALAKGDAVAACAALSCAESEGAAAATTAPLFAEAAFYRREFDHIPRLLRRMPNARGLDAVVAYWTGGRET